MPIESKKQFPMPDGFGRTSEAVKRKGLLREHRSKAILAQRFTSSYGGTQLMGTGGDALVGEVDPTEAWQILSSESTARLVDVRTRAEWGFVGVPDIGELGHQPLFVEWSQFPDMSVNPAFVVTVEEAVGSADVGKLLFICRSGARSLHAAHAVAAHFAQSGKPAVCLNVAEGFEGDLDALGHRGSHNGWKARGLAWRQS